MLARLLLTCLGCILAIWGVGMPMVALFGTESVGHITHVRRQLGDRGEAVPNRYGYSIGYEFRLPDGSLAHGTTHRVGDYFSPKYLTKGRTVKVRHFSWLPAFSTIDWNWGAAIENLIVAAVGSLLAYLPWTKKPGTRKKRRPTH
jgi:hypothetical protein